MQKTLALIISLLWTDILMAQPVTDLRQDLDQDGFAEVFALIGRDDGEADLLIAAPNRTVLNENMMWTGAMAGQEADLGIAANGSILLTARNDSIGRNRWSLTLTIAYRDNTYKVAGMTYRWYDTLDLENSGECDVNLLSGRGFLTKGDGPQQPITTQKGGVPVAKWSEDILWQSPCGGN